MSHARGSSMWNLVDDTRYALRLLARSPLTSMIAVTTLSLGIFNLPAGDTPERLSAARVTRSYLDVAGVQPMLGRAFTAGDYVPGPARVALLSHALWQRRFSGAREIVGQSLQLDGREVSV